MKFWSLVIHRATQETASLLGVTRLRRLPFTIALFFVAVLTLRFIPGGVGQVNEEVRWAIAVALAGGIVFLPVFLVKLLAVPAAIYREQTRVLASLQQNDVNQLIDKLERESIKASNGEQIEYSYLLAGELADDLAISGVTIPDQEAYRGLRPLQWRRFLSDMEIYGLVEPVRRIMERDKGYPYTETDYFLTKLGREVVARIHKRWEAEYGEGDT